MTRDTTAASAQPDESSSGSQASAPETSAQLVSERFLHWKITHDGEGIVWLACDRANETNNSLSEAVLRELDDALGAVESGVADGSVKAMILTSAKASGFIAGADIREFDGFGDAAEVTARIREGHRILARVEALRCPTVAAIDGFCLGGGLELALCCDYLIATDRDHTRIGLPEVKLGIFPGLGGSVRLTEKLGGLKAMQLMLTGRVLRARPARAMGVIDAVVDHTGDLHWSARKAALQKRRSRPAGRFARLTNRWPLRQLLARTMRKQTAAKANPRHYPAPFRLIDLWETHRPDRRKMFDGEATGVGELMVGDTARNLRRIFFMTERMKGLGKAADFKVRRVHVVGAGVMGGDIAAWCASQGMEVTLQDRELQYIEPALKRAGKLFKRRLRQPGRINSAKARLTADVEGKGAERADVVIEAIFEDADAKRALFADLEPRMPAHAVLATNTSAIPLEELARDLQDPSRLIGLHFFNPVAQMQLVEVVHGEQTDPAWITRGNAFCSQINRFPLPVKSSPGFLVNRVLAPYLMEALTMYNEGLDKATIDASAEDFGMPMGPMELADVVGLDVCLKVAESLSGDAGKDARVLLQQMIDRGDLGKKSGNGFYQWVKGKAEKPPVPRNNAYNEVLAKRLIKPFLDECRACAADGIVEDDELLDAGIIFGTGFAPFHGGPMAYMQARAESATATNSGNRSAS